MTKYMYTFALPAVQSQQDPDASVDGNQCCPQAGGDRGVNTWSTKDAQNGDARQTAQEGTQHHQKHEGGA